MSYFHPLKLITGKTTQYSDNCSKIHFHFDFFPLSFSVSIFAEINPKIYLNLFLIIALAFSNALFAVPPFFLQHFTDFYRFVDV